MTNKHECWIGVSSRLRGQRRWNLGRQRLCGLRTWGTDIRLVFEERRERAGISFMVNKDVYIVTGKRAELSRLRGVESVFYSLSINTTL